MYSAVGAIPLSPATAILADSVSADEAALKMILDFEVELRGHLQTAMAGSPLNYAFSSKMMYALGTAMVKYAGAMDAEYSRVVTSFPHEAAELKAAYGRATSEAAQILAQKIPAILLPIPVTKILASGATVTIPLPVKR